VFSGSVCPLDSIGTHQGLKVGNQGALGGVVKHQRARQLHLQAALQAVAQLHRTQRVQASCVDMFCMNMCVYEQGASCCLQSFSYFLSEKEGRVSSSLGFCCCQHRVDLAKYKS